jgi:acyl carrier protein
MNDSFTTRVRDVIAEHFRIDADRLTDEARLRDDLGADWLDRLELMIAIEDQVAGVKIDDVMVDQIYTVGDLMRVIESALNTRTGAMMAGMTEMAPRQQTIFSKSLPPARLEVDAGFPSETTAMQK